MCGFCLDDTIYFDGLDLKFHMIWWRQWWLSWCSSSRLVHMRLSPASFLTFCCPKSLWLQFFSLQFACGTSIGIWLRWGVSCHYKWDYYIQSIMHWQAFLTGEDWLDLPLTLDIMGGLRWVLFLFLSLWKTNNSVFILFFTILSDYIIWFLNCNKLCIFSLVYQCSPKCSKKCLNQLFITKTLKKGLIW